MRRCLRFIARALPGLVALGATACMSVVTIDDVVPESAAITDDRFVGEWVQTDGDSRARVVGAVDKHYAVTYIDKSDTVQFDMRLGRVGSTTVLDVFPDMAQWKAHDQQGIPTHLVFGLAIYADSLVLRDLDADSVKTLLAARKGRVPYSIIGDNLVLHGDPAGVRSALAELFDRYRFARPPPVYRRK